MHGNSFLKCCILFITAICFFSGCGRKDTEVFQEAVLKEGEESLPVSESGSEDNPEMEEPEEITIYICGEVCRPGVYVLREGSRICDALEAAGGMTEAAADTYLNQAQLLTDGEKIYVPDIEEYEAAKSAGDLGEAESLSGQSQKISINKADREELTALPGIGSAKADAIITYREAKGGFTSLEELMQVDGIKEGTFEKIRDLICL